jgi:hypothetical protein
MAVFKKETFCVANSIRTRLNGCGIMTTYLGDNLRGPKQHLFYREEDVTQKDQEEDGYMA